MSMYASALTVCFTSSFGFHGNRVVMVMDNSVNRFFSSTFSFRHAQMKRRKKCKIHHNRWFTITLEDGTVILWKCYRTSLKKEKNFKKKKKKSKALHYIHVMVISVFILFVKTKLVHCSSTFRSLPFLFYFILLHFYLIALCLSRNNILVA
jgi:membrane-associated HD superfamily phosphohydrolase